VLHSANERPTGRHRSTQLGVNWLATMATLRHPVDPAIFLTGNGRSGTSWVGATLASAPGTLYYPEPCNPVRWRVAQGVPRRCEDEVWSTVFFPDERGETFRRCLDESFRGRPSRNAGHGLREYAERATRPTRVLIKEVAAFASVEWVAQRWNPRVVVIWRHPGAYAASVRDLRNPGGELRRFELLRDRLASCGRLADEVLRRLNKINGPFEASVAAWAMRSRIVMEAMQRHHEWHSIRFEHFALNPVLAFQELYATLGLRFTPDVLLHIERTSNKHVTGTFSTSRISSERIDAWRNDLTEDEIATVRRIIEPFDLAMFGAECDW
jgi:hypothetical protein